MCGGSQCTGCEPGQRKVESARSFHNREKGRTRSLQGAWPGKLLLSPGEPTTPPFGEHPRETAPAQRPMAPRPALLLLLALARAISQPNPCEYETNRIKDLLQASCQGKGLSDVPSGLEAATGILLLGTNRLARVSTASFVPLHNLTDLDLSGNGLAELEAASPLPGLQELDLSHNALKALPLLEGFPNLARLALGHNALSQLPEGGFRALGKLVDLELQGNQLSSLPEGAFAGLAGLKDLDLSDNRLGVLPPELLAGLEALETLRLERNRLRSVPEGFFPEGHIFAYVYLVGNPWVCDCALEYLRDWIVENEFSVYTRLQGPGKEITENQPENVTCHDPPEELGHPVMKFSLDCTPESNGASRGDGEESVEPQTGPGPPTVGPHPPPEADSAPHTAFFTQPDPSPPSPSLPPSKASSPAHSPPTAPPGTSPTSLGGLATTRPQAPATSTGGFPLAPTTASPGPSPSSLGSLATTRPPAPATSTGVLPPAPTTASTSPSPSSLGSLATTHPQAPATSTGGLPPAPTTASSGPSPSSLGSLATTHPQAPATSTGGLPLAPTTATPDPGEPQTAPSAASPALSSAQSRPAPSTAALPLPATTRPGSAVPATAPPPPADCHCPMLPGVALGLSSPQPSPVSWGAWLAARCCPLRLALYVACLVLVSLPSLALLCWWVCACTRAWHPQATQGPLGPQLVGYQPLQKVARERRHGPGEGCQPLPRPRLYRVCKRLELAPLRYVTWLLVSLPGPSGQWPWERKGSLEGGRDGQPGGPSGGGGWETASAEWGGH